MDRDSALRTIRVAMTSDDAPHVREAEGNNVVLMSGLTIAAREALLNRELVIRYFPFSIGRQAYGDPRSST